MESSSFYAANILTQVLDRNETPDATHLAEFHQVEGVIADYDITLGNLIGKCAVRLHLGETDQALRTAILEVFMKKAGLGDNLRFKPGTDRRFSGDDAVILTHLRASLQPLH